MSRTVHAHQRHAQADVQLPGRIPSEVIATQATPWVRCMSEAGKSRSNPGKVLVLRAQCKGPSVVYKQVAKQKIAQANSEQTCATGFVRACVLKQGACTGKYISTR